MKMNMQLSFRHADLDEESNMSMDFFAKHYLNESKVELMEPVAVTTRSIADKLGYGCMTRHVRAGNLEPIDNKTVDDPQLLQFIEYCVRDTLITVRLTHKFGLIATKRKQAEILCCPSSNLFMSGITHTMLYKYYLESRAQNRPVQPLFETECSTLSDVGFKMMLVSAYYGGRPIAKRRYEGAIVVIRPGIHSNVIVLDFELLYPLCIIESNNSRDTARV